MHILAYAHALAYKIVLSTPQWRYVEITASYGDESAHRILLYFQRQLRSRIVMVTNRCIRANERRARLGGCRAIYVCCQGMLRRDEEKLNSEARNHLHPIVPPRVSSPIIRGTLDKGEPPKEPSCGPPKEP